MSGLNEVWKPVIEFNGRYEVSNTGKVRSLYSPNGLRPTPVEKVLQKDKHGYFVVGLYENNRLKLCKVHRLVAEAFIPNPKNKPQVNHKDTVKSNNHYTNLEWSTPLENTRHARANNLFPRCDGDLASYRVFSAAEISLIKRDIILGLTTKELFARYPKLNTKHLYLLRHNKSWQTTPAAEINK